MSEEYQKGIRRAQTVIGNGGDPSVLLYTNSIEKSGIDAAKSESYTNNKVSSTENNYVFKSWSELVPQIIFLTALGTGFIVFAIALTS